MSGKFCLDTAPFNCHSPGRQMRFLRHSYRHKLDMSYKFYVLERRTTAQWTLRKKRVHVTSNILFWPRPLIRRFISWFPVSKMTTEWDNLFNALFLFKKLVKYNFTQLLKVNGIEIKFIILTTWIGFISFIIARVITVYILVMATTISW